MKANAGLSSVYLDPLDDRDCIWNIYEVLSIGIETSIIVSIFDSTLLSKWNSNNINYVFDYFIFVRYPTIQARYASFESALGLKIVNGQTDLEECEEFIREHGEPAMTSGQQEHYESIFNRYL